MPTNGSSSTSVSQLTRASSLGDIDALLSLYFDGLYEGDADKLAAAFHPVAHLYSVNAAGQAVDLPLADWLEIVRNRPSAAANGDARDDRIVMVDQSGPDTAFAKVQCQLPPRYFTDYLTLGRVEGTWRIVAKVFHTETRPA